MPYTTQGLMTAADIADHEVLTDAGRNPECPGHDDDPVGQYGAHYHCSRAEDCPDAEDEGLADDLSYEEMYGERP